MNEDVCHKKQDKFLKNYIITSYFYKKCNGAIYFAFDLVFNEKLTIII